MRITKGDKRNLRRRQGESGQLSREDRISRRSSATGRDRLQKSNPAASKRNQQREGESLRYRTSGQ
jgi:hypothetical protein